VHRVVNYILKAAMLVFIIFIIEDVEDVYGL